MLLIYPPVARSTEAPPGIARLAGFLRGAGVPVRALDLNAEGFEFLLGSARLPAADTRDRLALRRRESNLALIRDPAGYGNFDRYKKAAIELNRSIALATAPSGVDVSLGAYRDPDRSPLKRTDLVNAARHFEANVFFPLFRPRLDAVFADFACDTVGVSLCYLGQALNAFAIIGYLKRRWPEKKVLLGGSLVTSWTTQGRLAPRETFDGLVDGILPGLGEESLRARLGLSSAPEYAIPDFADFTEHAYFAPGRIVPYNFSSGCPWKRCSFCPEKAENNRYVATPPTVARAQLAVLAERWSPALFHFTDSEIAPSQLRALAASPPGAPWYGFARFGGELSDPGFCVRLAASGCRMLQLGLESGDQDVLDALGKGTKISEISVILGNLDAAGIGVYLYALFGTPAEDRNAALRTRDFIAEHAAQIDFINAAIFNLPAGSEEAKTLETREFYEGELSLYREFRHPKGWNRDAVRSFLASDFESCPPIRRIVLRNPPFFTSNHAAFFVA